MALTEITSNKIRSLLKDIGKESAYDVVVSYCHDFANAQQKKNGEATERIKVAYQNLSQALAPMDEMSVHFFIEKLPVIQTMQRREKYDGLAPDGSEIYLLQRVTRGGMVYCILPPKKISQAVKHKTIEELWYIGSGTGKMWRMNEFTGDEGIETDLVSGTSINIPTGTHFQFRNDGSEPLVILLVSMPPWPGETEAVAVENHWRLT